MGPQRSGISLNGRTIALAFLVRSGDLDVSWGLVPPGTFQGIAADATVVIPGTYLDRSDEAAGSVTLNVVGLAAAYAKLRKRCDNPVSAVAASQPPSETLGGMALAPIRPGRDTHPAQPASTVPGSATQAVATSGELHPWWSPRRARARDRTRRRPGGRCVGARRVGTIAAVEAQLGGKINPAHSLALKRAMS